MLFTNIDIHPSQWWSKINERLQLDRLMTNELRFEKKAISPDLVLATWSGTLQDESNLPMNWLRQAGFLVSLSLTLFPVDIPTGFVPNSYCGRGSQHESNIVRAEGIFTGVVLSSRLSFFRSRCSPEVSTLDHKVFWDSDLSKKKISIRAIRPHCPSNGNVCE